MDDRDKYSTWLEIDLGVIQDNIRRIKNSSGQAVMAVVKANGYGHGMLEAALAASRAGAEWCAVARIEEALALRKAGITLPLLVMGYTPSPMVDAAAHQKISLSLFDIDTARFYSNKAQAANLIIQTHIKIDSGMGRLGIFPEDGVNFIRQVRAFPGINVEGIFTHFARADEPGENTTSRQLTRFLSLINELKSLNLCPIWVHAGNSAAVFYFPESHFNLIRPGISIYGLNPSDQAPLPDGFLPALSWKARLVSIKQLPKGHGVSYGHRYCTRSDERIGALPVGYADGLRRRAGNHVLIHGQRTPIIGTICMDQCMVQLDNLPNAVLGDEVVLIGQQGNFRISADDIARDWGTINYEVVCGLAARIPRIYYGI